MTPRRARDAHVHSPRLKFAAARAAAVDDSAADHASVAKVRNGVHITRPQTLGSSICEMRGRRVSLFPLCHAVPLT